MSDSAPKTYTVGTLTYSFRQMIIVMICILQGGLTLNLLAYKMVPNLLPILLDRQHVSSATIALTVGTIPSALNFFMCPIVSTSSDKFRSRWGRRIPYLAVSTPFVTVFMILLGWAPELGTMISGTFTVLSPAAIIVGLLCVFSVLFQISYLVPGAVFYYLFNDVIPKAYIGRFMSAFTFVGTAITFVFNYFILELAVKYTGICFTVIGILYAVSYTILCVFVREGKYDDPPKEEKEKQPLFARIQDAIQVYFKECFFHRIYVFFFLMTALNQVSNLCRQTFNLLFATKDLGMTSGAYGRVIGIGAVVSAVVILIMGKIMDKYRPIRVYLISEFIIIGMNVWGYFWVYSEKTFFVVGVCISVIYAVQALAGIPLGMEILPRDKYGQFCSANSMINCCLLIVASYLGGLAIDWFGYRFIFVWDFIFTLVATLFLFGVFFNWKKLGGEKDYVAPRAES